jgi:hypothetical protein
MSSDTKDTDNVMFVPPTDEQLKGGKGSADSPFGNPHSQPLV